MLSAKAAQSIYERVRSTAGKRELAGSWLLDFDGLRECGLSGAKARTLCAFGAQVGSNPDALDHWYTLSAEALIEDITRYKGMGAWTASIIALFYVGHEDVFPHDDGSIQRALRLIDAGRRGRKNRLDPDKAAPYRSYLALYLWHALDTGVIG
jgi:DNA-3-methyladenine glycosylase II